MKTFWLLTLLLSLLFVRCSTSEKEEKNNPNTPCEFKIQMNNSSEHNLEYQVTYNGHHEYATLVSNTSNLTPLKFECEGRLHVDFSFEIKRGKTGCRSNDQHTYKKSYSSEFINGKTIDVLITDLDSCNYHVFIETKEKK